MIMRSDPEQRGFYEKKVLNSYFSHLIPKEKREIPTFPKLDHQSQERKRSRERSPRINKERTNYKESHQSRKFNPMSQRIK